MNSNCRLNSSKMQFLEFITKENFSVVGKFNLIMENIKPYATSVFKYSIYGSSYFIDNCIVCSFILKFVYNII